LKGGFIIPRLLNSSQLDVQASHFRLTISHNDEAMIQKSKDVNFIFHMWLKIQSSAILDQKLNEYMKVAEITMVMVLGLMEDERTFNNLAFMKIKLRNQLTHTLTYVSTCSIIMFTLSPIFHMM
jgi:hypothetical protein